MYVRVVFSKPLLTLRNFILFQDRCESKLDSSTTSGEVFPGNYEIFLKDRINDNVGGGGFIAVHNNILTTHESKLHCLFSKREGLGSSL